MNKSISKLVAKLLKEVAEKIESGNCEITNDQAMDICDILSHEPLSKEQACSYLNISRSRFDLLISEGRLPKGIKRRGFKELIWYKDRLCIVPK